MIPEIVRSIEQGSPVYLRDDLEVLRGYLRADTFEAGLQMADIRRVVEIGIGATPGYCDYNAMYHLSSLRGEQGPFFQPKDLWATEPALIETGLKEQDPKGIFLSRFTTKRV